MVSGPWFFDRFGGGWRFAPGSEPGTTVVTWRYNFATKPRLLRPIADRIGRWLLQHDELPEEPLLFPPDSAFNYSNTDNIVVALMAEAATGRS